MNVVIIDYGVGNLRSLRRGLERAGATVTVSDDPAVVRDAPALVLPGVGAFGECVRNSRAFHDLLVEKAADTPVLGVCVGLQLMYDESTEGVGTGRRSADPVGETGEEQSDPTEGLGLIPGRVERLDGDVKVPHMGWNTLSVERDHPLVEGIDGQYAYFVHSYRADVTDRTLASCGYGGEFAAIAANERGNVVGTQFHPEKSGETGLRILRNFVEYCADRA